MLQYRIPGAQLLAAAVIAVCFVIALVVINMQAVGRSRSFGVSGLVMLVASTVLQALSGSVAGVYGTNTLFFGVVSIVVAVLAAAGLVLLALGVTWARKATKPRGGR